MVGRCLYESRIVLPEGRDRACSRSVCFDVACLPGHVLLEQGREFGIAASYQIAAFSWRHSDLGREIAGAAANQIPTLLFGGNMTFLAGTWIDTTMMVAALLAPF
jgi:hypothetical protein